MKGLRYALIGLLGLFVVNEVLAQTSRTVPFPNLVVSNYLLSNGSQALQTIFVNTNGDPITSFGGNADAADGASFTQGSTLSKIGIVRRDTASAGTGVTDGEVGAPSMNSAGMLWVTNVNRKSDGTEIVPVDNPCADDSLVTTVAIDTASSGNVQLVALTSGQTIFVCGYDVIVDSAVDFQFIYGTGSACATGETDITGPMGFAANGGVVRSNGGSVQFKTAASNALCLELSGAVQTSGYVSYVKQVAS